MTYELEVGHIWKLYTLIEHFQYGAKWIITSEMLL
jgi:hypothetical protein